MTTVDRHPPVVLEPRAVTVACAAEALGLGLTGIREEIDTGRLRSFRRGRRVLIPVSALDAWVETMEQAS